MNRVILCALVVFLAGVVSAEDTFVKTKNGTIKGLTGPSANGGGTIYIYKSLPYGKAPVGPLRFKNPEPTEGWKEEVFDGTQSTTSCPQHLTAPRVGEDCLQLNVFTKHAGAATPEEYTVPRDEDLLPVMVFLFGGGFALGDNSFYTGTKLLAHQAVLVVPNYRVGVLGFLSTGDEVSPGNYGLKDQNLALRWVQENIRNFGGDPNRVTIFGESAGGASALYHLISPASRGLFHQVIAQSGTPLAAWATHRNALAAAQDFSAHMKCPTDSSKAIIDCLRGLPHEDISLGVFNNLLGHLSNMKMELPACTPVIEPNLPGAFLTEDPYKLFSEGELPDVPVILGSNLHEGSFVLAGFYFLGLANSTKIQDPFYIHEDLVPELLSTIDVREAAVAETIYLGFMPGSIRDNFDDIMPNLVDIMGVFFNKGSILRTADILSRRLSNVYMYSFEQESKNSLYTLLWNFVIPIIGGEKPPVDGGVMHADELIYMFNFPFIPTPTDRAFSTIFNEIWTNFAATGNPTPEASDKYVSWPTYNTTTQHYYRLAVDNAVLQDYAQTFRAPYNRPESTQEVRHMLNKV